MYDIPDGNNANFELILYTPPAGNEANFEFEDYSYSERDSEIHGIQDVSSDRTSQIEGSGVPSDRDSEILGKLDVNTERASQILGKRSIPLPRHYRIVIYDEDDNPIGEISQYKTVKFGKRLNDYGSCSFDIACTDPKAASLISLRKYTTRIFETVNNEDTSVWAGEQASLSSELRDNKNNWATVNSFTFLEKLMHRYNVYEVSYVDTDQGEIVADMIQDTNMDDDTKITIGTIEETYNRDVLFYNQNIYEAITTMSDVLTGFDFEVTDDKVFNLFNLKGEDKTNSIVFKYGENIKDMRIIQDFTNPVNRAIVLGEAYDEGTLERVEVDDTDLQTEYGLREGRIQISDVLSMQTFEDKGLALIRKQGGPLLTVDFTLVKNQAPLLGDFDVGDGITLIVQEGLFNIYEQYRIYEWEATVDSNNAISLKLVLGKFI